MKGITRKRIWIFAGVLALCILALLFLLFRPRTTASLLPSHGSGLTYGEVIRTAKGLRSESLICTPAQLEDLENWFAHSTLRWSTPDGGQFQPYESAGYTLTLATGEKSYTMILPDLGTLSYDGQIYKVTDGLEEFLTLFSFAEPSENA